MSFFRTSTAFSSLTRRVAPLSIQQSFATRTFSSTSYQSAQGTGAEPTKGGTKSSEESSAQSGGARSKEAKETGSSPTGGEVGKSGGKSSSPGAKRKDGALPKIHDKSEPAAANDDHQAEVEQHNKEFEQGHDRAPPAAEDKVDKKFWKGEFYPPSIYELLLITCQAMHEQTISHNRRDSFCTI
jgi:hypothetical protein